MNDVTAWDVKPGQTWRFEVAQQAARHEAVVDQVTEDGHVKMFGSDELIPIGSLLAYWRWLK